MLTAGNPLGAAGSKKYRAAVLHLLPQLRLLDGKPGYAHRTASPAASSDAGGYASASTSTSTTAAAAAQAGLGLAPSYASIHLSTPPKLTRPRPSPRYARDTQVERIRRGLGRCAAAAAGAAMPVAPLPSAPEDGLDADLLPDPAPRTYVPPWRRTPNPLPHGWCDYAGIAAQCLEEQPSSGSGGVRNSSSSGGQRRRR